jgi:hypothetical protein
MIDGWQRRQAVQLTAMLPEKTEDARLVLKLALELVNGFLSGGQSAPEGFSLPDRNLSSITIGNALSSPR